MDDSNKPQSLPDQTPAQPFETPQSTGQHKNENTYWESQTAGQTAQPTPENPSQVPLTRGTPTPDVSSPESPAQFYQYYQQQMNGESSPTPITSAQPGFSPNGVYPTPLKKKSGGKVVAAIIILLLIISGAATAYAFQDTLMNTFVLLTKSPAEYYAYVEKDTIKKSVDSLTPYLNFTSQDVAYDTTTDITFHREALDSLMQSSMGMSMADLESMIGVPIENIGLDLLFGYKDGLMSETLGLRLNQIDLITIDLFIDTLKQEMLIRLPELSSAYLKQSLATSDSPSSFEQLKLLTADRSSDFLKRYGNIIVENVTQVELEKNVSLALDSISIQCNKLTVDITEDDVYDIALAILDEAKDDDYILDLLPMFDMTIEEYQKTIEEAKAEMNASHVGREESVQMIVYVDNHGNVIGRAFGMKDSLATFGYTLLSEDNYEEFNLYVKDDKGNMIISAVGNQTMQQDAYDGAITLDFSNPTSELLSNVTFDIKFEDVRHENRNNRLYQYGTYTISSLDLMGLQVMIKNTVVDDLQLNKLIIQMGASPLVTIDLKTAYLKDYEVMTPVTSEIYDFSQAESYLATFKLEEYISNLSDRLGVDLQSMLEPFLSNLPIE